MMAAVHLENLLTTRFVKGNVEVLAWEHQSLADLVATRPPAEAPDLATQLKLAEIKLHLASANRLFYARSFREAMDEYKLVQGLVWGLIQPSFNPDLSFNPELVFPLEPEMFDHILDVSLDLIAQIPPKGVLTPFGPLGPPLPDDVKERMSPFTGLGVDVVTGIDPQVREVSLLGIEAARRGEWERAEQLFSSGLDALGDASSDEASAAKASLQMNLGVVALQAGKLDDARPLLDEAAAAFAEAGDEAGQAQAALNLAASWTKAGDETAAAEHLQAAEALLHGRSLRGPARAGALRHELIADVAAETIANRADSRALSEVAAHKGDAVTFLLPGAEGWDVQPLKRTIGDATTAVDKQFRLKAGDSDLLLTWTDGEKIDAAAIEKDFYKVRVKSTDLGLVNFRYDLDGDLAARLPQLYFFSLPVAIGDCLHELGEYEAALKSYQDAAQFKFINETIEVPALWIKVAQNYLAWGDNLYRDGEVSPAVDVYSNVVTPDDGVLPASPLYSGKLGLYGNQVKALVEDLGNAASSPLNAKTTTVVMAVRNKLRMIEAGLDFFGFHANHFPIFKFDYLHSVATYFAQQAVQAEREYINFTSHAEDEELTREQLRQSVEMGAAQVDLAQKQVDQASEELAVARENAELAATRVQHAQQQRNQYADVSYEMTALDAASTFASGPEGYSVSYTYYSPSEGKNVTISGSDAYLVMEQAAWKKGLLARDMELANMDRNIAELQQNQQIAQEQVQAAEARVAVALEQRAIAEMSQRHAEDLLEAFESQLFTPEVWFQLGKHLKWISDQYLARAIGVARKMQQAYELETGFRLTTIKSSYTTNVLSGLLSANYLLLDIDYFTIHRIDNVKAKDVPIKQQLSLAALSPIAFETTFKSTGRLEFETNAADFDRAYPGSYLRKIKKVEVVVEGLLPPGGVVGTLKNSGISRDRKSTGETFFRIQPRETLYVSQYSPRVDAVIFQPDQRVLDVFEHCGVATGWTLEIPPGANDVDFRTISDVKVIVYYTAQHNEDLEAEVKAALPATGQRSTSIPFRLLFPDEFFGFVDTGTLSFELRDSDFAYNETALKVRRLAVSAATHPGTSSKGIHVTVEQGSDSASAKTDAHGIVRSDPSKPSNPFNVFVDNPVAAPWTVTVADADNPGLDRSQIRDLFLFVEYGFEYRA